MAFPRRLLTENEELVLDLRPHWIGLAGPLVASIADTVAVIFLLRVIPHSGATHRLLAGLVLGAGLVLLFAYPVRTAVRWATSHFVVTSDRIVHRTGLVAKESMEIPLEAINDVRFRQSVFERVIGAGDLIIESAGTRGAEVFDDVRDPEHVQKTVYEMGERNQRRMMGGGAGPVSQAPVSQAPVSQAPVSQAAPSHVEELAKLAELHDRGALTDEEFRMEKAKLLGVTDPGTPGSAGAPGIPGAPGTGGT